MTKAVWSRAWVTDAIVAEPVVACANDARAGRLARHIVCRPWATDQARVVVIGGGITGCSVAYHLALAGWTDVLLVEKAQLTAGSTCQAAGLVTAFNPSSTMMAFRRYSIELYRRLGAFETVGSLRLASSPDQLRELERTASRARGIGLDAEVIGADEARRADAGDLGRLAVRRGPPGRRRPPRSARRDPRRRRRRPRARRPHPDRGPGDRLRAVGRGARSGASSPTPGRSTPRSSSTPPASGRRRSRRWSAAFIPSTPVDHQHIALKAVPGSELPRDMPCFRDPDNLVYGKSEHGGMVFGGYETDPVSRWEDGVPWDHAAASLPAGLRALRAADGRGDPALPVPRRRRGDPPRLPSGRDDARRQPAARPAARGPRLLGRRRAVAQRVRRGRRDRPGDGRLDHGRRSGRRHRAVPGVAVRRHVSRSRRSRPAWPARRTPTTTGSATRTTRTWPVGRGGCPPLHGRLQEAGAVFGTKAGWERADYHEPGRPWRRAGRDQAA